jgi:hypothetical protein
MWRRPVPLVATLLMAAASCSERPAILPLPASATTERPATATTRPASSTSVAAALPATRPATHLPPFLLHLPGIGGTRTLDEHMARGFVEAGFVGDIQIYDWTGGDEGLPALRNLARNHEQAKLIAAILVARHDRDPSSPIYLSSHSGGAGLAVWALEDLPPSVQVRTLLFMSPALSPSYDLTKALRHVAGHAYAFTSLADSFVLGIGTRTFGTIDGVQTDAAGRIGFKPPPTADPNQYAKLVQFPYRPQWLQLLDHGDHVGGMTRQFARQVLAPLVLSGTLPIEMPTPSSPATAPSVLVLPGVPRS